MVISSIRLKQTLSARVASTGIQSAIPIGGSSTTALTTTNADIAYGFSMTSGSGVNVVTWTLNTHTLSVTGGGTDPTCTEDLAGAVLDANGDAIPAAACAVAIYYEIPSDTAEDAWVMATANSAEFGTIKLIGTGETHEEQIGVRSALLVPRQACASKEVVFTFSTDGVQINVVYLANTTFT